MASKKPGLTIVDRMSSARPSALPAALLLLAGSLPGHAQSPDAPAPAASSQSDGGLDEIVVTAQRRSENLEKVAVSVSAFGSSQLAERAIVTQADLQVSVPGLQVRATSNSNDLNFALRGQSVDAYGGSQPAVVTYVNDVQSVGNSAISLFDLDSVQVLKGPQGTLFGRNATGGAVLFDTAKPTFELGGFVMGRFGNYGLAEEQAAVNIPVIDDTLAVRIAVDIRDQNGYINDLLTGNQDGATRRQAIRLSVLYKMTDQITNTTVFEYDHLGGDSVGGQLYAAPPCGTSYAGITLSSASCAYSPANPGYAAFLAAHPYLPAGGLQPQLAAQALVGPFQTYSGAVPYQREHVSSLSNTTAATLSDTIQVKNILGLGDDGKRYTPDLVGSSFPLEPFGPFYGSPGSDGLGSLRQEYQASDELQLLGKAFGDRLSYIVGLYYSYENSIAQDQLALFDLRPSALPLNLDLHSATRDHSEAVFGQGTYDLGDLTGVHGLSLVGGFRYTWEQLNFNEYADSAYAGAKPERSTYSDPSWQVGLNYQMTDSLLLYAVQRGSWRTGGFNASAPAVNATASGDGNIFLPETTYDVEGGMKFSGDVLGIPSRLNVAVFNQWVDNVQRQEGVLIGGAPAGLSVNVPQAEITGVELDTEVKPLQWLSLGGAFAYTNSKYSKPDVTLFGQTLAFGPYADTPKYSGSIFGQATLPVPRDLGSVSLRADVFAQSYDYFSNLNNSVDPGTRLPGYGLVNLRLAWKDVGTKGFTVAAFAKNVTNKGYYVGGFPGAFEFGTEAAIPGTPRMYGVELTYAR